MAPLCPNLCKHLCNGLKIVDHWLYCPNSNKLPNLVTLVSTHRFLKWPRCIVTGLGLFSPLWQNCKSLAMFDGLNSIWQNIAKWCMILVKFSLMPKISKQQCNFLVTLQAPLKRSNWHSMHFTARDIFNDWNHKMPNFFSLLNL